VNPLDDSQKKAIAAIAAGFAGLISLFNIAGRFFWASMSDRNGRKNTYFTFFLLGIACYALSPWAAHAGSKVLFVAFVCIILSMYGGGFATVPSAARACPGMADETEPGRKSSAARSLICARCLDSNRPAGGLARS
jgi:MFS family permease